MAITTGVIGAVGGLASAGAGIAGAAGGGGSTAWHPSSKQMKAYEGQYNTLLSGLENTAQTYPGQVIPQFQSQVSALENNPYATSAQDAANLVSSLGLGAVAPAQLQGAASLQTMGNMAAGVAPQLLNTAFDPQQALYNRTYQQTMDQQNAINAMSGIAGSPYGAGVAGQTAENFNIDWQNQQLARELQGVAGLGSLTTTAGRGYAGASDLGTAALGTIGTAGTAPYNQYVGNINTNLAGLNALNAGVTAAYNPSQLAFGDIAQIMGIGQAGQSAAFQQGQTLGNNLGQSLSYLQSPQFASSISGINQLFAPSPAYPGTSYSNADILAQSNASDLALLGL